MEKLNCCYSINLDEETAQELEKVASFYQRKPRELLRLLIKPLIIDEFAKIQAIEHQENQHAPTVARFHI